MEGQKGNRCLIAIGMSGTGKTTFVNKLSNIRQHIYTINLDPAVRSVPYQPFIDIRKTHDYKKVMKDHKLGPNGAILTALNLYLSQPEAILNPIEQLLKKYPHHDNLFVIDIPGQIQVFTWSSSSLILVEALATLMPIRIVYIMDSVRCRNPNVFLSNIVFAQSIQHRFEKYPFTILLNKSDCADSEKLRAMTQDYQLFLAAIRENQSYLATLGSSIILNLSDFYCLMKFLPVSAKTGVGISEAVQQILK